MKVNIVIPLANVDESIVGLELLPNFIIENWTIDKLEKIIVASVGPSGSIADDIDNACCSHTKSNNVIVVSGNVDKKAYFKKLPKSASFYEKYNDRGLYISKVKDKINIMRLYKEGQIETKGEFVYEINNNEIDPILYSDLGRGTHLDVLFSITTNEKKELSLFLKKYNTPLKPQYIQLAFESFTTSYSIELDELAFLTLMIGVEAIFNDGQQELKYRISRGMAVLLGSKYDAKEIYKWIQELYNKRSRFVHTGLYSELKVDDLGRLRFLLRESIKVLLDLNITKQTLSMKLTEAGFGDPIIQ